AIVSSLIHEVNQPLTAISAYMRAGMRLTAAGATDKLAPIVARSAEQVDRATGIIRHLRDFVARRETERQAQGVPAWLTEAGRLALIGSSAPTPPVEAGRAREARIPLSDRTKIEQVFSNLVRTAAEAMADAPRRELTITATVTPANL